MLSRDFPVGLGFAVRCIREEVGHAAGEGVIRGLEQQARGAQGIAVRVLLWDDDVQPAMALPSAPELLESEGGGSEHGRVRCQAGQAAELRGEVGVGVDGPRDEVVVEPEEDEVRDGIPRGLDPAREVHGFLRVAEAVALRARGVEGQPEELLMRQREIPGQLRGVDVLRRGDEPFGDFDGERAFRVVLAQFLVRGQQGDGRDQGFLPSQAEVGAAQGQHGLQAGREALQGFVFDELARIVLGLGQAGDLAAEVAQRPAQHRAVGNVELLIEFAEALGRRPTGGDADELGDEQDLAEDFKGRFFGAQAATPGPQGVVQAV